MYYLDKADKDIVKEHRIYLYRDKIRVSPYGDADNDWLETDKKEVQEELEVILVMTKLLDLWILRKKAIQR